MLFQMMEKLTQVCNATPPNRLDYGGGLRKRQQQSSGQKYMTYILQMGRTFIEMVHGRHDKSWAEIRVVSNYFIVKPRDHCIAQY